MTPSNITNMVNIWAFDEAIRISKLGHLLQIEGNRAIILKLFETYETLKQTPPEDPVHDAIRFGLNNCPRCGSGDVRWCGISVRPYCNECGHWGMAHHGNAEQAIERWNKQ